MPEVFRGRLELIRTIGARSLWRFEDMASGVAVLSFGLAMALCLLLLLAGDVERNPGPNGGTLTMEDLPVLVEKLTDIAWQWNPLGVQLKFPPGTLKAFPSAIQAEPIQALQELLTHWLQRENPPPTLEALVKVIGGPVIGNELLARTLLEQRENFPSMQGGHAEHPGGPAKKFHDSFHYLGSQLFNTWPYHCFKKYYKSRIEDIVKLLCLVLLAYHFLAMTLITICEDGGFQSVFDKEEGTIIYYEVLHRLLMFGLRIIVRVVIPAVCLAQFATIGAEVRVPKSGLSGSRAVKKLLKLYSTMFSLRHESINITQKSNLKTQIEALDQSASMAHCLIKAIWTIPLHSVLFTGLLLYLGAFFLAEEKIMMEGICNLNFVSSTTVALQMVNTQVLLILECASIFFTILLVGVTKDFYTYENRIAIFAVMVGGKADKLYWEVRRRWRALDCLCYSIPIALAGFVVVSFATGRPFTPDPPHELKAANLATWYFWVSSLSVLTFLASSTNLTVRIASLVGDIFAILFSCMNHAIEGITITPDGDSIIVVLFAIVAVLAFNLLFSLCRCHYYHCDRKSRLLMWYCVLCMFILPILVIATTYREVAHLAHFVAK